MLKTKIKNIAFFAIVAVVVAAASIVTVNIKNTQEENIIVGVHVKGAVKNPGYYELSYGTRIKDAIESAGGANKEADIEKINLAQKLRDGEEIIVPYKEIENKTPEEKVSEGKININVASSEQLCSLEGIGEETAAKIIDYRKKNGKFSSVDELKNVSGIGNAKFEKIENSITV